MLDFSYHNPTRIVFGQSSIEKLGSLLPEGSKVMLLYGGGSIKTNGVYDKVISQLSDHECVEFGGIEANPEYGTLLKAVTLAIEEDVDFLLAVGGGSVIDGAKFVAAAAKYSGDPWDILEGKRISDAIPMGCVLTLPATGSETNPASVVNRTELQLKRSFVSPHVRPRFAVLDPQTTFSLPVRQLINGIVDPFVHAIEQYLTYPIGATVQDRFAEAIMLNLIELGPQVFETDNYQVRANVMWNATQALSGLIGVGVPHDWSTHMIGHELSALYGLDHAVTLAIVLPRVMHAQREQKRDKLLQYAERVWQIDITDGEVAIDIAIERTEQFFRDMGMKTRLSEHGIDESCADKVMQQLIDNGYTRLGEHRDITPERARDIVLACM